MDIAIIGAGIAGLTLAAAMERAGLRYRLYEQATELREVGAGILLAPNATRILNGLGLSEALDAVSVPLRAIEARRWDTGQKLGRFDYGDDFMKYFGAPFFTIHRADLQQALLSLVPREYITLNAECTGARDAGDHVELDFADGSTVRADVAIGADGIHSAVRNSMIPDDPRFIGRTAYGCLIPVERLPGLVDEPKMVVWMGPDFHCIYYLVSGGRLINFSATTSAGAWRTESWLAEGDLGDLAEAYAGWSDEVRQVIAAADSVNRWALYERDGYWGQGRMTLVGDSAHAALPFMAQGSSQAIEDAVVLAACLQDASTSADGGNGESGGDGGDVARALRRYEGFRKERVDRVRDASRSRGDDVHLPDGERQRQRDAGLGATMGNPRSFEWLYGYDAELALHDHVS